MNSTKLPLNFKDLSEHAPLMYNMVESQKFQPIHFDFRCQERYVILGRFKGSAIPARKCFKLSKVELAVYTWDTSFENPPLFLVNEALVDTDNTKNNELHINLKLNLLQDMDQEKLKKRLEDHEPECVMNLDEDVFIGGRVFFHIINYDEFLEEGDIPLGGFYVSGRSCNGIPVIPGDQ